MDSSPTPHKEKKGLTRLWTKVKLAVRPKSKSRTTTADTSQPSNTTNPQPVSAQRHTPDIQPNTLVSDHPSAPTQPQTQSQEPLQTQRSSQLQSQPPPPGTQPPPTSTMSAVTAPVELPAHSDDAEQSRKTSANQPVDAYMVDVSPTQVVESAGSRDEKDEHNRRYERAQAIFKKYNMEFNEADWEMRPYPQGERVHKTPRMRVRWTCHECKTTFGHDKICVECAHQRCRNCPRYPPKKKKAKAAKKAAASTAATGDPTQQEPQEGTCHECQTTFDLGTPECSNCHHPICERCLQETVSSAEHGETEVTTTAATAAS